LKFKVVCKGETILVDMVVNKPLNVQNSLLIREYCLLDARFHMLALFLKSWWKEA
jgi:DNA polymerase sigma